jgi:hypothetical protein
MAIATTATTNYTRDQLITLSARAAGLLHPSEDLDANTKAVAADLLWTILQGLQARGIACRATDRATATLTAGQAYFDAADDTVSVESGITVRSSDGTDLPVVTWSRQQYERQPNKATTGRPIYAFPEEQSGGTWRVWLWPVPTSDWATATYPRQRRSRDVNQGNYNIDIDHRGLRALMLGLGADLARSMGSYSKWSELNKSFEDEIGIYQGDDSPKGPKTFVFSETPWG